MIAASDIEALSLAERLQVMEMICNSFAKAAGQVSSPPWHGDILAGRAAKVAAGQGHFLTLDELRQRLNANKE
jgi:putative addiction module component (TIGR02574 family)